MSFAASPPENEDQRLGIAARMLGLLGLSTFLALTIWLLVQWPSLQPQLRMDWDPFWLKMHAAAILAVGILVWRAKGKVLLTLAAAVTLAVVATPMVNGATGWALPKLAILTALAVGLGQQGLKRLVPNAELAVGERLLLATVLGYGAISLLMFALGLLHCWRPAIVATVLWIAGLMVASDILDVFRQVRDEARDCWAPQWRSGDLRLAALAISLLCICGFGSYLFAVAPATHWDVLHYHLGIPRIYAERGELADLDHTWAVHCVRNGEMLYLLGLLIKGQPLPTLINFQFGLLAAGLVASLGALLSDRRTGLLAGCIFFALPLVSYVLATGMIDLILTAYVIAATYAFFRWKREGDAQWISLFSLFAGLAAGTKLNGLLLLGPFAAFLLADALYLGPDRRARLTNVARMIVPGLCALAPWLALTWIRTGNPVFPYLNKVFRSAAWYQQSNNGSSDWPGFGLGKTWFHALRLPWDMTFHGERFCEFGWYGTAGILLLGLPFGYFLVSKQQRRAMLELSAAILVWLAAFLKVAQYSRYMLPVFAFSAIVAALNCQIAWRVAARIPRVRWISLSLCVIGGCGWVFFTRTASIAELWLCHPERYPWRVALRVQRPDEYLHAALQGYEFMSFIDRQMPQKPVSYLGVGLGTGFYSGDAAEYSQWHSLAGKKMIEEKSPRRLIEMMRENRLHYVAINHLYLKDIPDGQTLVGTSALASASFLKDYCEPVYGRKNIALYRVHYDGVERAAAELGSLFQNSDLRMTPDGALPGWCVAPGVKILPEDRRPGGPEATVLELTHNDLISQRVLVHPNTLYTLSADFWSPLEGQSCLLQLMWIDPAGQQVENEMLEYPVGDSPERYELSRTSLPEAVAVEVYIRAKNGENTVRMSQPRLIERNVHSSPVAPSQLRIAGRNK